MSEVNEAGQLQLIEPPFIRIERIDNGPLSLAAKCVHDTEYRFTVADGVAYICTGVEHALRLPSRFGVPQTWTELVNLAYRVLVEAPCHHAG